MTELFNIFRMMAPADLLGVQKNIMGAPILRGDEPTLPNVVEDYLRTVFQPSGNGSFSVEALFESLKSIKAENSDVAKQVLRVLRVYGLLGGEKGIIYDPTTGDGLANGDSWHAKAVDYAAKDGNVLQPFDVKQLIPFDFVIVNNKMRKFSGAAVVLSDSHFINPARYGCEKAELFMNFIPPVVMQRCVPYLSAEFVFDGESFSTDKTQFARPGLLRFLMGGATKAENDVEEMLLRGTQVVDDRPDGGVIRSTMGMEAFTSPQTLVSLDPAANANRIVPVLDPFRPLATIESLNVTNAATIGMMDKKRAQLTMKLHDRSRLNELADFVRPATYPRTRVWLTWGWRHPYEPGNPYADFINGNMLIRENYGVKNASYSFDNLGQVQITLDLFADGAQQLLDLKINDLTSIFKRLQDVVDRIANLRLELKIDGPEGLSKDIKAWQIIDAGSQGQDIDLVHDEIDKQITELDNALKKGGYDKDQAAELIKALNEYYGPNKPAKLSFKEQRKASNAAALTKLFNHWETAPDPFLMTQDRIPDRERQTGAKGNVEIAKLVDAANKGQTRTNKEASRQRIASLGKILTSVLLSSVIQADAAEEIFLYFYRVNSKAGRASGINLAEFPIDLTRLKDDLANYVTRNRTDRIALDAFLNVLIRSQVEDIRSPAYGLQPFFEVYDASNPDVKLKSKEGAKGGSGQSLDSVGDIVRLHGGPIQKPQIHIELESTYGTEKGEGDLLLGFQLAERRDQANFVNADKFRRILKIHVYDKTFDPNPAATAFLGAEDDQWLSRFKQGLAKIDANNEGIINDGTTMRQVLEAAGLVEGKDFKFKDDKATTVQIVGGLAAPDGAAQALQQIKALVAQTVPTILIGGNASNVTSAQLQSKTDDLTSTTMIIGASAGKGSPMAPAGGTAGGLPLRVFPATLSLSCLGNPLLRYSQLWFIDFNTGTTVDDLYYVTGLSHTLTPGKFETQCTFSYQGGYGKYMSPASAIEQMGLIKLPDAPTGG